MTITLNLPDDLVESLKVMAERKHIGIDALVRDGIEQALKNAQPTVARNKINSLETVHAILQQAGFVAPDDMELSRLKDERVKRKYGEISPCPTDGNIQ